MIKTCYVCRADKPHTDFNRHSLRRDGLQSHCRECSATRSRCYYQANTEKHRLVAKKRRDAMRELFKQRADDIKRRFGCRVCGESDVICLDFHHLDPAVKKFDIAAAMSAKWSWEIVREEIRKCVCLCLNCHRKVHAGRFDVTDTMLCDV